MDSTDRLRRYHDLCEQLLTARTRRMAEEIFAQIELDYPDTLSESDRLELDDWEDDEPLPDYEEWIDGVHKRQIERRRSFSEQLKKKEQIDWISLSDDDDEEKETKVIKKVKPRLGDEPSDVLLNNARVSLDAATPSTSTASSSLATALALHLNTRSVSTGSRVDGGEVGLAVTGSGSGSTISPGTSTTTTSTTPVGPIAVVKRRPGRPRKSSLNAPGSSFSQPSAQLVATGSYASTTASNTVSSQTVASTSFDPEPSTSTGSTTNTTTTTPIVVKRGRGRPRKVVVVPVPEPSPSPSTRPKRAAALASSEKIRSLTKPRKRVVVQRQSLNQLVDQSNVQQQQGRTLTSAEEPGPSGLNQESSSLKRLSEDSTSFASGPKRVTTFSSVSTSTFYGPSSSSSTVASTSSFRPEASNHKSGNLSTINRFRESIRGKLNNQPNMDKEIRDFGESMNPSASRVRLMVPAAKKEKLKPGPKPKKQ